MLFFAKRAPAIGLACFSLISVAAAFAQGPPKYAFDQGWPKPLPNEWIWGHVEGIATDSKDDIWVLNLMRSTPADDACLANGQCDTCCTYAPEVVELDPSGNVMSYWGGPGFPAKDGTHLDWMVDGNGFTVDGDNNIWVGGGDCGLYSFGYYSGGLPEFEKYRGSMCRRLLKFSPEGKILLDLGKILPNCKDAECLAGDRTHPGTPANNQDTTMFGGVFAILVDDAHREVYVGDGSLNRRVIVIDKYTGAFKRGWGAYGIPLSEVDNFREPLYDPAKHGTRPEKYPYNPSAPPARQFRGPVTGLALSRDGLLYVADRGNDRVQVFTREGKFVKEFFIHPRSILLGTAGYIALSHDPGQKYLFVADQANGCVWIYDRRSGVEVGHIGRKGHMGGEFDIMNAIALDSRGNLYTTEVKYQNRIQRFLLEK